MKRIYLVLAVAAVMAMMFVVTASPAFAQERVKALRLESPRLVQEPQRFNVLLQPISTETTFVATQ